MNKDNFTAARGALILVLLAGLSVLGACEGDNLFSGDNSLTQPRVNVVGPDVVIAGDSFQVRVDGFAARGVARLDVSLRGAMSRDTSVTVGGTENSVSQVLKFRAPAFFVDTTLVIAARVTDKGGFSSNVRADTVAAFGPPGVVTVSRPDSVRAGQTVTFRVRATGARRITQLNVSIRGAVSRDETIPIVPPRLDVTQEITVAIPAAVTDTLLRVAVVARDEAGLSSTPLNVVLPLSIDPPTAAFVSPPVSASAGGTLNLTVRGTAMRGVATLRLQVPGVTVPDVTINPPATTAEHTFTVRLPGNLTEPSLTVRAFAVDRGGVTSPPATAQVQIPQGVPSIVSITSPQGTQTRGGATFDVRVEARSVRPLRNINVRFRGAVNSEVTLPVDTTRTEATVLTSAAIPLVVDDTTLQVIATATDVSGAVSPIAIFNARVTDVTAPNVTATVNPGQASAGRSVTIRVSARDNVGLSRFGFAAVTPAGDTIGSTPTLATTRGLARDSTFTFNVPTNLTPTTLRVIGVAIDHAGLRANSAPVTLAVVDSTLPTVTVIDPADNSSFANNTQILVRARVADNSGIRRVTFKGVAIRTSPTADTRVVDRFTPVVVNYPQPPSTTLPRDIEVQRFLVPIAGDNTSETVHIVAIAEDSLGNVASDTNRVTVGGPSVTLTNPVTGTQVQTNGTFQITAEATDPIGLDSMKVYLTGVIRDSIVVKGLNGATSARINQPYTVGTTTGTVDVIARAWNRTRPDPIAGSSASTSITITSTAVTDTQAPTLSFTVSVPERAEVDDDTIKVTVRAQDVGSSGVARIGVVVIANPDSLNTGVTPQIRRDTIYVDRTYTPARAGGIEETFRISLDDFLAQEVTGSPARYAENGRLRFPRRFTIEVHAFAIDAVGNCGAAIGATVQSLTCAAAVPAPGPDNGFKVAAGNVTGTQVVVTAVLGMSIRLPNGGTIADAVVDPRRRLLYMSNITLSRIEFLDLATNSFQTASGSFGLVGSAPWGLSFNNNFTIGGPASRDTLIVANSGGTNLSFIPLDESLGDRGREATSRRLNTPNTVLFDILIDRPGGIFRYTKREIDFSDRPQFVGVMRDNVIAFSTVPTGSAPDGSIRYVDTNPNAAPTANCAGPAPCDNRPEVKLLFNQGAVTAESGVFAVANIDSMTVFAGGTSDDLIELYDHLPGRWDDLPSPGCWAIDTLSTPPPGTRCIRSGRRPAQIAIRFMELGGSDIRWFAGFWNRRAAGMSDTTFVAVSDDRTVVGFGEGATAPTGRIMLCCTRNYPAGNPPPPEGLVLGVSQAIAVQDLINNASERVLGIGLNNNGTLGVARGTQSAYFFTRDLRLQGQFSQGVSGGSGGAALHPDHNSVTTSNEVQTLAFIPTNLRTIKIVNTVHFFQSGEIPIRDNVVGPLRAVRPYATDNTGVAVTDPNYVFVKLVGVTEGGQVVIVNVRRKDVGL